MYSVVKLEFVLTLLLKYVEWIIRNDFSCVLNEIGLILLYQIECSTYILIVFWVLFFLQAQYTSHGWSQNLSFVLGLQVEEEAKTGKETAVIPIKLIFLPRGVWHNNEKKYVFDFCFRHRTPKTFGISWLAGVYFVIIKVPFNHTCIYAKEIAPGGLSDNFKGEAGQA